MLRFSQSNSDFTANSDVWSRIPGHILMPLLSGMVLLVFSFNENLFEQFIFIVTCVSHVQCALKVIFLLINVF